jgi:cytochrome c oxidase assembly factor CtaG
VPRWTVAALLLITAIYVRGFRKLRAEMPDRFPASRLCAFIAGIAALLVALASPLEALDDSLLSAHMIQHLILMLAAPILILQSWPAIPLVRGLPVNVCKLLLGPVLKSHAVREIFARVTHPITGWIAFAAATWLWHTPAAFQLALRSEAWHAVEHSCFFATALMFWFPVVQPWPSRAQWPRWAMIPYLLLADGQNTILAALFTFSEHVLYPYYSTAPRLGGITPLNDQIVAGVIMWIPAALFFLVPAVAIMLQMLAPQSLASRQAGFEPDPIRTSPANSRAV